jgi:hypothetical protein
MAWKEVNLRADLTARFYAVDPAPVIIQPEDTKGVTWLQINVLEVGFSEDKNPAAYRKNIDYYVFHRGLVDEDAWYARVVPSNETNKDISNPTGTSDGTNTLYMSSVLRKRVQGQICKTIQAILWEGAGVPDHAKRVKLAWEAMKLPAEVLDVFMRFVAVDATVKALGGLVTDVTLETVVNSWWTQVADSAGF